MSPGLRAVESFVRREGGAINSNMIVLGSDIARLLGQIKLSDLDIPLRPSIPCGLEIGDLAGLKRIDGKLGNRVRSEVDAVIGDEVDLALFPLARFWEVGDDGKSTELFEGRNLPTEGDAVGSASGIAVRLIFVDNLVEAGDENVSAGELGHTGGNCGVSETVGRDIVGPWGESELGVGSKVGGRSGGSKGKKNVGTHVMNVCSIERDKEDSTKNTEEYLVFVGFSGFANERNYSLEERKGGLIPSTPKAPPASRRPCESTYIFSVRFGG